MVFLMNGYNYWHIIKGIHKEINKGKLHKKVDIPTLTFPYIKGTTNKIGKILSRNIMIAFTPTNTIRIFVDSMKESLDIK